MRVRMHTCLYISNTGTQLTRTRPNSLQPSPNIPYIAVQPPIVANLKGFYLVDRTAQDDTRRFVPTPDNILPLKQPWEIQSPDDPLAWSAFAGRCVSHPQSHLQRVRVCTHE